VLIAVESHFKLHKTPFVAANTASRLLPSQYLLLRSGDVDYGGGYADPAGRLDLLGVRGEGLESAIYKTPE
jgi:hypothetical protein